MEKRDVECPSEKNTAALKYKSNMDTQAKQNIRTYVRTHGLATQNYGKQMLAICTKSKDVGKDARTNNRMTILGTQFC